MEACIAADYKVLHLVVDSGALIKNSPIHEIGKNIYTITETVTEIKDKATKQRLQFLPYQMKFREPPTEIIKLVSDFSKKTGDYPSLSAVDIKILALTYLLEKEHVGIEHLNTNVSSTKARHVIPHSHMNDLNKPLAGFYCPQQDSEEDRKPDSNPLIEKKKNFQKNSNDIECVDNLDGDNNNDDNDSESKCDFDNTEDDKNGTSGVSPDYSLKLGSSGEESDFSSGKEDSKENEGWITPNNILNIKKQMDSLAVQDETLTVACITTDFAMQNVLLQLGLHVVSVDGLLIQRVKTFVLRCYSCFKTTSIMTKQFCPNCGNKTLKRVAVSVNENGEKVMHINFSRPINIRGTKYSLSVPKGGKHATNPILCEDQPVPQNRPSRKGLKMIDVFDPDYESNSSPFALHDVYSRAATLGIRKKQVFKNKNRNPNENKKKTGNKCKKM